LISVIYICCLGFYENRRPEYDVYYFIDLSIDYIQLFSQELDKVFRIGAAHDSIVIGHGDYRLDPITKDPLVDRIIQLTPVAVLTNNNFIGYQGPFK